MAGGTTAGANNAVSPEPALHSPGSFRRSAVPHRTFSSSSLLSASAAHALSNGATSSLQWASPSSSHSNAAAPNNAGVGARESTAGSRPTSASTMESDEHNVFTVDGEFGGHLGLDGVSHARSAAGVSGSANAGGEYRFREAAQFVNRPMYSRNEIEHSSCSSGNGSVTSPTMRFGMREHRLSSEPVSNGAADVASLGMDFHHSPELRQMALSPQMDGNEGIVRASRPPVHESPAVRSSSLHGRSTAEAPSSPFTATSPSNAEVHGNGFSSRRRFSSGSSRSGSPPRRVPLGGGPGSIASRPSDPFSAPGSTGSREDSDQDGDAGLASGRVPVVSPTAGAAVGVAAGRRAHSDDLGAALQPSTFNRGSLRTQSQKLPASSYASSGVAFGEATPEARQVTAMRYPSDPPFLRSQSTGSREAATLQRHHSMTPFRSATLTGGGSLPPLLVAQKVAVITPLALGGAKADAASASGSPSPPRGGTALQRRSSDPPQSAVSGGVWAGRPSLTTNFSVHMQDVITSPAHDTNGPEGFEPESAPEGFPVSEDEDEACCGLDLEDEGGWGGVLDAPAKFATCNSPPVEQGGSFHGVVGISTTSADDDLYVRVAARSGGGAPTLDILKEEQNEGAGDWHMDGARRRSNPVITSSPTGETAVGFRPRRSPRLAARRRCSSGAAATPRLAQPGATRSSAPTEGTPNGSPTEVSL